MEFIIVIIVILIYSRILNVNINYMLFGGVVLLYIISVVFAVSFLFCNICLLCSKRKEARFLRVDKFKNSRYEVAYYLVEGEEYPCIFPKEGIMESRLYKTDKIYYVMLNKRLRKVYDPFAFATCVLGLIFSTVLSVGITFLLFL